MLKIPSSSKLTWTFPFIIPFCNSIISSLFFSIKRKSKQADLEKERSKLKMLVGDVDDDTMYVVASWCISYVCVFCLWSRVEETAMLINHSNKLPPVSCLSTYIMLKLTDKIYCLPITKYVLTLLLLCCKL